MKWLRRQLREVLRSPRFFWIAKSFLFTRGVVHLGRRYRCPCCGWGLRSFTTEQGFFSNSADGYCPRCNAKARHRRIWLYLEHRELLASGPIRILEVAPWVAFARRLQQMKTVEYSSIDLERRAPFVTTVGDVTAMPFGDRSFDAVVCVHVLEHVEDDHAALAEIHRVLADGWALVTVPLDLTARTDEDPSVVSPEERTHRFGEASHVRLYGLDIVDRLEHAGFSVDVDFATELYDGDVEVHGLRRDEHILMCVPAG